MASSDLLCPDCSHTKAVFVQAALQGRPLQTKVSLLLYTSVQAKKLNKFVQLLCCLDVFYFMYIILFRVCYLCQAPVLQPLLHLPFTILQIIVAAPLPAAGNQGQQAGACR